MKLRKLAILFLLLLTFVFGCESEVNNTKLPYFMSFPSPSDVIKFVFSSGSSNSQDILIGNAGDATLNITDLSFTGSDFAIAVPATLPTTTSPLAIAPKLFTTVTIEFQSTTRGIKNDTLTITHNAKGPSTYSLYGNWQFALNVKTRYRDFVSSPVNVSPNRIAKERIEIRNYSSTDSFSITNVTLSGGASSLFDVPIYPTNPIRPREVRDFEVSFIPIDTTAEGYYHETLTIATDEPNNTIVVDLWGEVTNRLKAQTDGPPIIMGFLGSGGQGNIRIINNSDDDLSITDMQFVSGDFSTPTGFPFALNSETEDVITVSFNSATTGGLNTEMTIDYTYNGGASNGSLTIEITGYTFPGSGDAEELINEDFNTNPSWTTTGDWEWGDPNGPISTAYSRTVLSGGFPSIRWSGGANDVNITAGDDDDGRGVINLGFSFDFYGQSYNSVWVSTNGWLSFGNDPGTNAPNNTAIPNPSVPNAAIFPFWDDLQLDTTTHAFARFCYEIQGGAGNRIAIIEWHEFTLKNESPEAKFSFQIRLNEANNNVIILYSGDFYNQSSNNSSATIGIEDENGNNGLYETDSPDILDRPRDYSIIAYSPFIMPPSSNCYGTVINNVYSNNMEYSTNYVQTPVIDCSAGVPFMLFEYFMNSVYSEDGAIVQVSTDGGTIWESVDLGFIKGGDDQKFAYIDGEVALSGNPDNNWDSTPIDLSKYAGQSSVIIRWAFYSNSTNVAPGFYIDEVKVYLIKPLMMGNMFGDEIVFYRPDSNGSVQLSWLSMGATSYDVYTDTSNPPTTQIATDITTNYVVAANLLADTTYYYYVVGKSGTDTHNSPVMEIHTTDSVTKSGILINEINSGIAADRHIELYNPGTSAANLGNNYLMFINNTKIEMVMYPFERGLYFLPGETLVLYETSAAGRDYYLTNNMTFGIDDSTDKVECILLNIDSTVAEDYIRMNQPDISLYITGLVMCRALWTGSAVTGTTTDDNEYRIDTVDSNDSSDWSGRISSNDIDNLNPGQ